MGKYVMTVTIAIALGALGGATVGTPWADRGGVAVGAVVGAALFGWFIASQPDIQASLYFESSNPNEIFPDEGTGLLLSDLMDTDEMQLRLDAIEVLLESVGESAVRSEQ
ncbi:MAG: hypothetical protein M5U23_13095 [Acidimicrobiia bacterium]|nr:hypothetical protein [Acidimicrobiia bacterium]